MASMAGADENARIRAARDVALELCALLHRDSVHRLRLSHDYPLKNDTHWTPDFQRRCKLAEVLCRKLDELLEPLAPGSEGDSVDVNTDGKSAGGLLRVIEPVS